MWHLRDVHSRWGDTGPSLLKETKEASEDEVSKGQGGSHRSRGYMDNRSDGKICRPLESCLLSYG